MKDLVSIVIPIYNVESFLSRCLKSIIHQTYENIEIILVDDGSTDNSSIIADGFAENDHRIQVYHKTNGGLSDARNYGIDRANGDYITFIDSDDYVTLNYIEYMYNLMHIEDADIVVGGSDIIFNELDEESDAVRMEHFVLSTQEALKKECKVEIRQSAWGKLYRRELFDSIRFPKGKLYEDLAVVFDLIMISRRIVVTNTPLYHYYVRSGSIMQSKFNIKHLDEIEIIESAMARVRAKYPQLDVYIRARTLYSYFVVLRRILLADGYDLTSYKQDLRHKITANSKGLLWNKCVTKSLKAKLVFYKFGEKSFIFLQKIADKRNPERRGFIG